MFVREGRERCDGCDDVAEVPPPATSRASRPARSRLASAKVETTGVLVLEALPRVDVVTGGRSASLGVAIRSEAVLVTVSGSSRFSARSMFLPEVVVAAADVSRSPLAGSTFESGVSRTGTLASGTSFPFVTLASDVFAAFAVTFATLFEADDCGRGFEVCVEFWRPRAV